MILKEEGREQRARCVVARKNVNEMARAIVLTSCEQMVKYIFTFMTL
jgi:hypothetical protein